MGKAAIFFSQCRTVNAPLHTGDEFGILLRQKKNATISVRETNRTKKSMSTTAQTYWQSSAEIWECQRDYSLNNEVDKDAISCFYIRKDWRFAVRAKSFALHWRSRGFFRGHVRSCEKGLCVLSLCLFGGLTGCVKWRAVYVAAKLRFRVGPLSRFQMFTLFKLILRMRWNGREGCSDMLHGRHHYSMLSAVGHIYTSSESIITAQQNHRMLEDRNHSL